MADAPDILKRIVAEKWREIEVARQQLSLTALQQQASQVLPARGFVDRLLKVSESGNTAVIAELKRASPSKGLIREHFDAGEIAADYAEHGAACLSVLTDEQFFSGGRQYLIEARARCSLPVLRKDFTVDPYQVYEARAMGADCILLICAILSAQQVAELAGLAESLGLDVLIEVHDAAELESALQLNPALIGINNRNLHTFEVSLHTTLDLLPRIPEHTFVVSESGISTKADVALLKGAGVGGFLVGESFMRAPSPGAKLQELFG